jgi:hypothetical protein
MGAVPLLLLVRVYAQISQSAPDAKPQAIFQLEVNHVTVDASVTDQRGNAVAGLTTDDFELFEDGKPQKIDTSSTMDIPVESPAPFPGVDRFVSADVRSNRDPTTGRRYLIVLDDANIAA